MPLEPTNNTGKSSQKAKYRFRTGFHPPQCISYQQSDSEKRPTLIYPTPTNPCPSTNHPVFTDAMYVRDKVFVVEQQCSAAAEIDDDDARSWEWVVYAQRRHDGTGNEHEKEEEKEVPVGVIRLVPPPHAPHANDHNPNGLGESLPKFDYDHEPYIKMTRVAVLKEFRGCGLSRLLMDTAENWARQNRESINQMYAETIHQDSANNQPKSEDIILDKKWNGLIGMHAQVQVEKMYQGLGYETDLSMETWDEEGIEHIGMFKRVDVGRYEYR